VILAPQKTKPYEICKRYDRILGFRHTVCRFAVFLNLEKRDGPLTELVEVGGAGNFDKLGDRRGSVGQDHVEE